MTSPPPGSRRDPLNRALEVRGSSRLSDVAAAGDAVMIAVRADGVTQTAEDLLAPVRRWTAYRKRDLLFGIADGVITSAEAIEAHGLSAAELDEWCRGLEASDFAEGLKATCRVPRS